MDPRANPHGVVLVPHVPCSLLLAKLPMGLHATRENKPLLTNPKSSATGGCHKRLDLQEARALPPLLSPLVPAEPLPPPPPPSLTLPEPLSAVDISRWWWFYILERLDRALVMGWCFVEGSTPGYGRSHVEPWRPLSLQAEGIPTPRRQHSLSRFSATLPGFRY